MRQLLVAVVAVLGTAFTLFACWRAMTALRRRDVPREQATGWIVLMVLGAVVSLGLLRLL